VLRAERNWSQAELADRLGVSRQTVNALETEPGAQIEAATGTLGITLNGRPVALKPGKIKGAIVVTTR